MNQVGVERGRAVRLAAELAVIVAGVFLGLAADSWRESRVERGRVAAYLRALGADVSSSIENLDAAIRADSAEFAQKGVLLDLLRGKTPPDGPEWRRLLGFGGSDVVLQTGTVRSLIGTGDIRLIESEQLRAAIVSLAGSLDTNTDAIRIADQNDWSSVQDGIRAIEAIAFAAGRPDTVPLASYRGSPALSAAYANHRGTVRNHLFFLRDLRAAFARVGQLIEPGAQR